MQQFSSRTFVLECNSIALFEIMIHERNLESFTIDNFEGPVLVTGFLQIISETIPRFDICHLICRDAIESTER